MRDQRDIMIEKQAELVSKLRAENIRLQKTIDQQWHDIKRLESAS